MESNREDLRRRYQALETPELLQLYREGGFTDSAKAILEEILGTRDFEWEHRDDGWLRLDFESFLRHAATLNLPDEYGDLVEPLFVPIGQPVGEMEIRAAEERIGMPLPQGYKVFLRALGPGCWCRANEVSAPDDVFAFDEPGWELNGFISIVQNVGGVGDHLAFNPADPPVDGDRPMYYCAHDPFGYAQVADSFETWARECAAASRKGEDFYVQFDDAVYAKWKEYDARQPKKDKAWWQFWR